MDSLLFSDSIRQMASAASLSFWDFTKQSAQLAILKDCDKTGAKFKEACVTAGVTDQGKTINLETAKAMLAVEPYTRDAVTDATYKVAEVFLPEIRERPYGCAFLNSSRNAIRSQPLACKI